MRPIPAKALAWRLTCPAANALDETAKLVSTAQRVKAGEILALAQIKEIIKGHVE